MLVLTRKENEGIEIGANVRVTIIQVRGDKVRVGIEAPKEVPVHRTEVADKIRKEANGGQKQQP